MARPAPVAWLRAHPRAADGLLAALVTAIQVAAELTVTGERRGKGPDALSVALVIAITVPIAWRRTHPSAALTVSGLLSVLYEVLGYHGTGGGLAVIIALYSAAAHSDRKEARQAAAFAAAAIAFVLFANRHDLAAVDIVANYLIFATAWILGDNLRGRRAHVAGLEDRAVQAERTRLIEATRAVETERARIAREMHDIVAHGMSVMVVQAAAAQRVLDHDPQRAKEAMASIEVTGRQALDEMRRVVGMLRTTDGSSGAADREPQPSALDIGQLVAQCRDAGLAVNLRVEGGERALPAGIGLAAYRIVQEALTNTIKHAGPATATVTVRFERDQLVIEVDDDGRGGAASNGGTGHGLLGMRERVDLYGGELRTGPRPGGGFRVNARLPLVPVDAA